MNRRIYLASSWRNLHQPRILRLLRASGHEVYDFRHPSEQGPRGAPDAGFSWSDIDPEWQSWTPEQYSEALRHPVAVRGFIADFSAMQWADTCVLLLPSGPSAAIEAGWCHGSGRDLIVHVADLREPELMYALARVITVRDAELVAQLEPRLHPGWDAFAGRISKPRGPAWVRNYGGA